MGSGWTRECPKSSCACPSLHFPSLELRDNSWSWEGTFPGGDSSRSSGLVLLPWGLESIISQIMLEEKPTLIPCEYCISVQQLNDFP